MNIIKIILCSILITSCNSNDTHLKNKIRKNIQISNPNSEKELLEFYTSFILENKKDSTILNEALEIKKQIKYFGKSSTKFRYYILTNFSIFGLKDHSSPKGKSELVFINNNLKKIRIYNFDLPEELPIDIKDNHLIFTFNDSLIEVNITKPLQPFLCVPKIGCFE